MEVIFVLGFVLVIFWAGVLFLIWLLKTSGQRNGVYKVRRYGGGDDPGSTVSVFATREEAQAEANLLNASGALFVFDVKSGSREDFIGPDGYEASEEYFQQNILGKSAIRRKEE